MIIYPHSWPQINLSPCDWDLAETLEESKKKKEEEFNTALQEYLKVLTRFELRIMFA